MSHQQGRKRRRCENTVYCRGFLRERQNGSADGSRDTVANAKPITEWTANAKSRRGVRFGITFAFFALIFSPLDAAEGTLTFTAVDEASGAPLAARIELTRPRMVRGNGRTAARAATRPLAGRTDVDTGYGFVIDGEAPVDLHEGPYEFRVSRGPESRIIVGNFEIEKTSEDEHMLAVPRILSMRSQGWTSGDCLVPPSRESLPIRMSAEDLHLAMVATGGTSEVVETDADIEALRSRRQRKEQPDLSDPMFIGDGAEVIAGLAFYHDQASTPTEEDSETTEQRDEQLAAFYRLATLARQRRAEQPNAAPEYGATPASMLSAKVAIEDPFAWSLPILLASGQIDGYFILGDWLRLDRKILQTKSGRPLSTEPARKPTTLGREAEQIYWETLNAGFHLAPLAGTGDEGTLHPVGYNRLYVAGPPSESPYDNSGQSQLAGTPTAVTTQEQWWARAWAGCSFATNGPLLQATIDGKQPGHVFETPEGVPMRLTPELTLTVRDPVDYLEVIHNGQIHYSARLDEYAKAGGRIPPLNITKPGWALIRVVTLHEDHFRAATTAPWYFEVDGERRVSRGGVEFFQKWLADYEEHLRSRRDLDLAKYAPFIRAARTFWQSRLDQANAR
ncbi:hypothetical protein FHS27_003419 [Rhodopirellula rubra]|uniref:Secreted protein n=1 Tax=Aporhodopirellula rubra TaxID=980271 RepID=A0A7W5H6L4_9BACT|nr:hypothetical protein [Aporhodopirellula rubra]MBB3207594.1 hypothetical protein [Aporhodopirellula rubra]